MNEILHANIFFFIASIAVVCFFVLVGVAMYHLIKIVKLIRTILEKVQAGSEILAEDAAKVRSFVASHGIFSGIVSFFMDQAMGNNTKRKRRKSTRVINDDEEE